MALLTLDLASLLSLSVCVSFALRNNSMRDDTVSPGKAKERGNARSTRKEIRLSHSHEMKAASGSPLLSMREKGDMMDSNPSSPSQEGTFRDSLKDTLRCCDN